MFTICTLYKFINLRDLENTRIKLFIKMQDLTIYGTILLASEGINGTISGSKSAIDDIISYIKTNITGDIECNLSYSQKKPFKRLKVKLKKEIVTMGVGGIDPKKIVGTYVNVKNWNHLITSDDVILVDTRNDYECEVGSFKGSINPKTESFREFPSWSKKQLAKHKGKKIAMFCTGGIRCEKSSAYLKANGFKNVYHLQGGILKYLQQVPKKDSLWNGECFVFDDRVTLRHNLVNGSYDQCHACRYPITDDDKKHKHYQKGVYCPRCYGKKTTAQLSRYRERELQINLANARGEEHIGDNANKNLKK